MVLLMRGLMAAYLFSALLSTATPIRRVNSVVISDSDAHDPESANLFPRAGKRTGPELDSDHAKQQKLESAVQQPNDVPETLDRVTHTRKMLNAINGECAAIAHTPKDEPVTDLKQSVVKFINDLVGDLPKLLQGNDKIAVEVKNLLIHGFITASGSVTQWDMSAEQMNAELGLDSWQQKVLPFHPTRSLEDTDVSYIMEQLKYIKQGIDKERLEKHLHMSMSACLFILAQNMKRLLHTDFKMLFPGIQRLSLNIDKGTLDVKEMSPELEELGKMLSLAFKVLWKAKEKVAEWDRSMAKVNSKSAIEALEFALSEVSNDQQVDLKGLKRRLKDVEMEKLDPVYNFRLHELVRGLIYGRIVDQRELQEKLRVAYQEVMEKIKNNINLDLEQTPMGKWKALITLT